LEQAFRPVGQPAPMGLSYAPKAAETAGHDSGTVCEVMVNGPSPGYTSSSHNILLIGIAGTIR
jgi:hypothetical protein